MAFDHGHWGSHPEGLMGSDSVVHDDSVVDFLLDLLETLTLAVKQPAVLDGVVHAFGKGIVQRIPTLGHADPYIVLLEQVNIGIGAVLAPPVRVVDQGGCVNSICLEEVECHYHSLEWPLGIKGWMKCIADNGSAVCISNE